MNHRVVCFVNTYPMDSIIQPLNNCIGSIPIVCPSFSFWGREGGRVGVSPNGKQKTATRASYGLQNIEIASYSRLKANKMEHNTQILHDKQITIQCWRAFIYSINWWTSVSSWSVTWSRNRMVKKLFSGDCVYRKISFVKQCWYVNRVQELKKEGIKNQCYSQVRLNG